MMHRRSPWYAKLHQSCQVSQVMYIQSGSPLSRCAHSSNMVPAEKARCSPVQLKLALHSALLHWHCLCVCVSLENLHLYCCARLGDALPRAQCKLSLWCSLVGMVAAMVTVTIFFQGSAQLRFGLQAPVALQKPHTLSMHGDTRDDPFYWLRDDSRTDEEVLNYLKAENEYMAAALAHTVPLQEQLFKEMKGRIQETDETVAVLKDGYYYYTRTFEGKQYGVHCRRALPDGAAPETEASEMDTR
jgi:hypothetical protein